MTRSGLAITALLALAAPSAAAAQTPTTPVAPPVPKPAAGKASLKVEGGLLTRKLRYVATRSTVKVSSKVRPFVAGETATLEILRGGKVVSRQRAGIRAARGGAGVVTYRFKTRRSGALRLRVVHAASAKQVAFASRSSRLKAVRPAAGEGARGTKVVLLQRGLRALGFAVPLHGSYDPATSRAVLAFRKTNNMARNGYASRRVYSLVLRGRGAFKARFPGAGRHVEFDWSRQVLALFKANGKPANVYHSSSGAPSTPTVFGRFRFYRKQPGTNALGMVHSNYFIRGYAIHGYKSVPNYPASHGCLRVPIPNALEIDRQLSLGQTIFVYR